MVWSGQGGERGAAGDRCLNTVEKV